MAVADDGGLEKAVVTTRDQRDYARMSPWAHPDGEEKVHPMSRTRNEPLEHDHEANKIERTRAPSSREAGIDTSAARPCQDPGPPPDGGMVAWTQVAMAHITTASTFGYIVSFGSFQTYYQSTLGVSPSMISWIGSTQTFLLFFIGTFSGRALDAGLFYYVYIAGTVFQLLGIFTTSVCTTWLQLFLAQALCQGIANGLHFTPATSLLTTYFAKKRSLAVGVAALGSCTGGVLFPIIVQQCLPRLGFGWTVRIIGFVMVTTNIITISFYRTRLPPRKTGPIIEWAAFREPPYSLFCAGSFFMFWGIYLAFFYVGSYARDVLDVSYEQSINYLLTLVCTGFVWRLVPNYFADKIGNRLIAVGTFETLLTLPSARATQHNNPIRLRVRDHGLCLDRSAIDWRPLGLRSNLWLWLCGNPEHVSCHALEPD